MSSVTKRTEDIVEIALGDAKAKNDLLSSIGSAGSSTFASLDISSGASQAYQFSLVAGFSEQLQIQGQDSGKAAEIILKSKDLDGTDVVSYTYQYTPSATFFMAYSPPVGGNIIGGFDPSGPGVKLSIAANWGGAGSQITLETTGEVAFKNPVGIAFRPSGIDDYGLSVANVTGGSVLRFLSLNAPRAIFTATSQTDDGSGDTGFSARRRSGVGGGAIEAFNFIFRPSGDVYSIDVEASAGGSLKPIVISATGAVAEQMKFLADGQIQLNLAAPIRLPRLTTAERDALPTPLDGWAFYNTDTSKVQARAGGAWVDLH